MLSHSVLLESQEKPFGYSLKVLYTNFKSNTIGFLENNLYSFCVVASDHHVKSF